MKDPYNNLKPQAAKDHAVGVGADMPMFTCSWNQRSKECRERGEMIGMLTGVKYMVDAETRKKIEEFLREIEE